jgi:hypothetical protein
VNYIRYKDKVLAFPPGQKFHLEEVGTVGCYIFLFRFLVQEAGTQNSCVVGPREAANCQTVPIKSRTIRGAIVNEIAARSCRYANFACDDL